VAPVGSGTGRAVALGTGLAVVLGTGTGDAELVRDGTGAGVALGPPDLVGDGVGSATPTFAAGASWACPVAAIATVPPPRRASPVTPAITQARLTRGRLLLDCMCFSRMRVWFVGGKYGQPPRKLCRRGRNLPGGSAVYARTGNRRERVTLADGDAEFTEFAQASCAGLRNAAYLLTGDRDTAEEAVQATLVRTYAAWRRVRREDAFAYARRVLVNYLADKWRRRLKEYATDDLPEPAPESDIADEVALRRWLTGALATLTLRERTIIVMRFLFDMPEDAVARDLGISPGTVKSTSSRALAKLRVSADAEDVSMPAVGGDRR
jgi:RNA polymerase sigma-70 factor (sigma-E family)